MFLYHFLCFINEKLESFLDFFAFFSYTFRSMCVLAKEFFCLVIDTIIVKQNFFPFILSHISFFKMTFVLWNNHCLILQSCILFLPRFTLICWTAPSDPDAIKILCFSTPNTFNSSQIEIGSSFWVSTSNNSHLFQNPIKSLNI